MGNDNVQQLRVRVRTGNLHGIKKEEFLMLCMEPQIPDTNHAATFSRNGQPSMCM